MVAAFYTPRLFDNKPSQAVEVNGQHPLARGLVFCAIPLGGVWCDLVSRQIVTHPGASGIRASSDGNKSASLAAIGANAAGGQFAQATGLDTLAGSNTLFAEASLEVNGTEQRIVRSFDNINGHGVGLSLDDASVINNGILYWAENGNRGNSTGGVLGTNSEQFTHRVMVTHDGATVTFYAKGDTAGTTSSAVVPVADANRRTTMLGSNGTQQQGSTSIVMAWGRVLSRTEYLALYANPWQVLRRPAAVIAVPAAAGGASEALSGSACTGGSGSQSPGHSIGL